MAIEPEAGLVIRYDFLWRDDRDAGLDHGLKDRPCAVVLVFEPAKDGDRKVAVCPITHSPPGGRQTAIEIPPKAARHLGLDSDRMWIKTDVVNLLSWERGRIPFGVTPANNERWFFGMLPHQLGRKMFEQVRENSRDRTLERVERD